MRYHNITYDDMRNGDGLRVVLWVSGCEHHCKGCHNQVTWNPESGLKFGFEDAQEIFDELRKDHIAGVTFSGGDPLHPDNREMIADLIDFIKQAYPTKTIWVYTGYTWEEILRSSELVSMVRSVDVLVDGRFDHSLTGGKHPWVGSSNQRVIDVQRTLSEGKVVIHESH